MGCDGGIDVNRLTGNISTHTSRVGCDSILDSWSLNPVAFLLTHPVWDVTNLWTDFYIDSCISTHTSRVGCDVVAALFVWESVDFYSHIPCGMWRCRLKPWPGTHQFLLTHPVWDVTKVRWIYYRPVMISTHTSRVGCDASDCRVPIALNNFYSHIPCGMWPYLSPFSAIFSHFYSHIPCGMWRKFVFAFANKLKISTHTSRVGCDFVERYNRLVEQDFYSHIPCGMWHFHRRNKIGFKKFLLTHPVWDVTIRTEASDITGGFLLTHPVWDVTLMTCRFLQNNAISTHTSRVGCDQGMATQFQNLLISTHTSRVGCDWGTLKRLRKANDFYSHIPCGMWLKT